MKKIQWIDRLKGIAGLSVLVQHALAWSGIIGHFYVLDMASFLLASFQMTVFFTASGYLLGIKESQRSGKLDRIQEFWYLVRRCVNLAVPALLALMLAMGTTWFFTGAPSPRVFDALWFPWVMIAVFCGHFLLFCIIRDRCIQRILRILLAAATCVLPGFPGKLLGYFLALEIGCLLGEKYSDGQEKKILKLPPAIAAFCLAVFFMTASYDKFGNAFIENAFYRLLVGLLMTYALAAFCRYLPEKLRICEHCSRCTYPMYLMEVASSFWLLFFAPELSAGISILAFFGILIFNDFSAIFFYQHFRKTNFYRAIFSPWDYFIQQHGERKR